MTWRLSKMVTARTKNSLNMIAIALVASLEMHQNDKEIVRDGNT